MPSRRRRRHRDRRRRGRPGAAVARARRRRRAGRGRRSTTAPAVMFTCGTTRATEGRRDHARPNYAFAGDDDGRGVRPECRRPPARRAAAVPRQRAVLLVRLGDRGRARASRSMPTFSASRVRRSRPPTIGATCASLFAGPIRMILASGGPRPVDVRRCGCGTAGSPRTSRRPVRHDRRAGSAAGPASSTA